MFPPKKAGGLLAALLFLVLGSGRALATDGYFSNGYGTACKAMAGACVSLSLDTLAPATNPAAIAFLGGRYDIAVGIFNPNRDYTVTGNPSGYPGTFGLAPGEVESDKTIFVIPSLGATWKLSSVSHVGVAIYGNGGMNTDYNAPTFGVSPTGVDLMQAFIAPTYAIEFLNGQALGVTVIAAFQRFQAEGLQAFAPFSSDPAHLTNNGYDTSWGWGVRVGYLGRFFSDVLAIGASYQTKMWMQKFNDYAGLFAEKGGFDIPSTWTAGFSVRPIPALTIAADYQQILYSDVPSIANPLLPNLMTARLGDDNGAGFGWRNMPVYRIGLSWQASPTVVLRGGYSWGDQPIPESQVLFNILAPGVVEQHGTLGLGWRIAPGKELNFSLVRVFSNSVTGPNPLEAPGQQQIQLRMNQWEGQIGFAFGF